MIRFVTWLWGDKFGVNYVNRLQNMIDRNLRLTHDLVCVVADANRDGIDPRVTVIDPPREFSETPNCIRRMKMYDPKFAWRLAGINDDADYLMLIDLDVVVVGDLTEMLARPTESGATLALWAPPYPSHNRVYAGGVVMMRPAQLEAMWDDFSSDPLGYGTRALKHTYNRTPGQGWGLISDQAMLNYHLYHGNEVGLWRWTEEIAPYNTNMASVPAPARIVTIGHEHAPELTAGKHPWMREHWR